MTRPPLRHLFLDLDGTLVDPFDGITRSLAHALETLGHPVPPASELRVHIGPPLSNAFRTLLGTSDDATLRAAIDAYRERYSMVGVLENRVYDGIPQTLHAFRDLGIDLHLLTSKPGFYARRVQKGSLVQRALDAEAIDATSVALVGDRGVDLEAARENGVFSIGVMWGYGTREELQTADSIVHSPSELLAHVRALARLEAGD